MNPKTSLIHTLAVCSSILSSSLFADDFPEMTQFSEDGSQLITAGITDDGFYNTAVLHNVYLQFKDENYWSLLQENYNTDQYILADLTYNGETYVDVGVQFKGNTSYRRLGDSEKTSFDIKVDWVDEDQDIEGYETLNFNNAFGDNSMMREVLFCNQIKKHTPTAKANFINLYINGENWGVYSNVEQLNKDFMDEWFTNKNGERWRALSDTDAEGFGSPTGRAQGGGRWGNGLSALNYLGETSADYRPYYTLKSNYDEDEWEEEEAAWLKLANVCKVLGETEDELLVEALNQVMDVDATLWFLAAEILFSDDDSYVFKGTMDYYLYINPATGRIQPLEFDGNSVLGNQNTEWSVFMNADNENYPLLHRLLNIPETRQRYLAHIRTLLAEVMTPEIIAEKIITYDTLIREAVFADPKKLPTYSEYLADLENLLTIVQNRINFVTSNEEVIATGVPVAGVTYSSAGEINRRPNDDEIVTVTATIDPLNLGQLFALNLYYLVGQEGVYTRVTMADDGLGVDAVAGDGVFTTQIPAQPSGSYIRYYVESVSNNVYQSRAYFPSGAEHATYVYRVTPVEETAGVLVINELMASNSLTITDEWGDYPDWAELYNNGVLPISLNGYYLSDDFSEPYKWQFTDITIGPGEYLVLWIDDDEEDQGPLHTSFKLSKEGEELLLSDPNGQPVDFIEFGVQETDVSFGRSPNGTGGFRALVPTPGAANPTVLD